MAHTAKGLEMNMTSVQWVGCRLIPAMLGLVSWQLDISQSSGRGNFN